jgi:uncharacterized protein YkwD
VRRVALAAAACLLVGGIGTPALARPTPSGQVRPYDKDLLFYVNHARHAHHLRPLVQSNRLYRVAHRWAEHMARRRWLHDNPHGAHEVARRCTRWLAYGENVAAQEGTDAHSIFELYMHDRSHRANILRHRFTNVGIATVILHRDGQTTEWDVMDFAERCR